MADARMLARMAFLRLASMALILAAMSATAAIRERPVEYKHGDVTLEGALVHDDAHGGRRPGVLIVHQWKGLGPYELKRAAMLAELGYVVFCADIYGKGIRADNPQDASQLAANYKDDRNLLRGRVNAALERFKAETNVDPNRIVAIGYCFGGTSVLELARSGATVSGVVSFHGGLGTPKPAERGKVIAKVLALHGADDPHVPPQEVQDFIREMTAAGVDWQLVHYGGAVHSFTDWNAGSDPSKGSAYNKAADTRSWEAMKVFMQELFR